MATYIPSIFEAGNWSPRVEAVNTERLAEQPRKRRGVPPPEFYFAKHFDNSRLVKMPDPARARQMRVFSVTMAVLFVLVMVYGLQHFSAIEGGYRVESEKQVLDQLREENRQLRLSEAQLTQPERIDEIARAQGLTEPQPGQIVHPSATLNAAAPVLAQVTPPAPATR
jgi:cell division protein FtsL